MEKIISPVKIIGGNLPNGRIRPWYVAANESMKFILFFTIRFMNVLI